MLLGLQLSLVITLFLDLASQFLELVGSEGVDVGIDLLQQDVYRVAPASQLVDAAVRTRASD